MTGVSKDEALMVKVSLKCAITVIQRVTGKKKCPVLNGRGKFVKIKSAGLVAPVCRPVSSAGDLMAPFEMEVQTVGWIQVIVFSSLMVL